MLVLPYATVHRAVDGPSRGTNGAELFAENALERHYFFKRPRRAVARSKGGQIRYNIRQS
jgi:hypothetical protein